MFTTQLNFHTFVVLDYTKFKIENKGVVRTEQILLTRVS